MWRKVRVSILLLILAIVGQQAILKDGPPNWKRMLYVKAYPINAHASIASTQTIAS